MKDWKDYDPKWIFKRPQLNCTFAEFPMEHKTTYGENFLNKNYQITKN